MLDTTGHQAAGLLGLARPAGANLLSMVCLGEEQTELPLLWRLCSALTELGYTVTVLDATQAESVGNPGLLQRMEYHIGYSLGGDSPPTGDGPPWTIVPSARGIQSLCQDSLQYPASGQATGLSQLQRLGQWFADDGVLVLYAAVPALVPLLAGTACRPLLAVSEQKNALLPCYLALKRLLRNAQVSPTLVHMQTQAHANTEAPVHRVADHLAQCARNFLGHSLQATTLHTDQPAQAQGAAMRRLALQMLENALRLSGSGHSAMGLGYTGAYPTTGHESRSH